MGTNSGVLRAREPVQIPVWLVIGVALALVGILAVATMSGRATVTRAPAGSATTEEIVARSQSESAEMAELKSGVVQRYLAEQKAAETSTANWPLNVAPRNRGPVKWGSADQGVSPTHTFGRHS
ncbi:MAG TPA: hypothetical protein VLE71_05755 [Actinomycetota bacterium]|nr:hypothetical protein [Actinomycetota bacterium]